MLVNRGRAASMRMRRWLLINQGLVTRSVRPTVRRWLSVITHFPVPRRPLLVATALTAAAAAAAAGSPTSPTSSQPEGTASVAAVNSDLGSPAAAAPVDSGRAAAAPDTGSAGPATDRGAKIAAAREKAIRAKVDRARALGLERKVAGATEPAPAQGPNEGQGQGPKAGEGQGQKAGRGQGPKAGEGQGQRAGQGQGPKADAKAKGHGGVPAAAELMPKGEPAGQSAFAPSRDQVRNATGIVRTGERLGMPPRAQVIAVATALQESKLENLGHLGASNDHDSLGLFQQRPSSGWGNPHQLTDPDYAAEQFYLALARVPDYQNLPLTAAAQSVQVSAFPDAYAQWEKMAADLVLAAHGSGPYGGLAEAE